MHIQKINLCYICACRSFGPSQQCCYDKEGSIITGVGGGSAYQVYPSNLKSAIGTMTCVFNKEIILLSNYNFIGHALHDIVPYLLCCKTIFFACGKYYDRRPNDDCSDYPERPPPGVCLYTPA